MVHLGYAKTGSVHLGQLSILVPNNSHRNQQKPGYRLVLRKFINAMSAITDTCKSFSKEDIRKLYREFLLILEEVFITKETHFDASKISSRMLIQQLIGRENAQSSLHASRYQSKVLLKPQCRCTSTTSDLLDSLMRIVPTTCLNEL